MKIFNNKLLITIFFICIFIFAVYNIISPSCNSSLIIEGFEDDNVSNLIDSSSIVEENTLFTGTASNTSPFANIYDSSQLPLFSSIFGNKCLLGCVSPTSSIDVDNDRCKQNVNMTNSNRIYRKCPWKCVPDILEKKPELKSVYAPYLEKGYPICEKKNENNHCSGCIPDAYF